MMSWLLQPEQFYDKLGHSETLPVTSVPGMLPIVLTFPGARMYSTLNIYQPTLSQKLIALLG